jgi:hypothetical protein
LGNKPQRRKGTKPYGPLKLTSTRGSRAFLPLACGVLVIVLVGPRPVIAGVEIDCEGTKQAWYNDGYYRPGQCRCISSHALPVCNHSLSGGTSKSAGHSADLNAMIVGTIFQSLLTSMSHTNTTNGQEALAAQQKAAALAAQQAAALQRAKEAAFQAEHDKMMKSFKQLDDAQGMAFKGLSDSNLDFKTLDGDMESLAANARKPFDSPAEMKPPVSGTLGRATPFFGDTMPLEDIRLLVDPENDPRVVDLRNAVTYVARNLKNEGSNPVAGSGPHNRKDNGKPITKAPDCGKLAQKLKGYITQRSKFQKEINFAQEQLNTWENANRNALLNAAKDGIEYFTGQLLEGLANRGKAADRLQQIYEKNAKQMAQEGLDIAAIESKIKRLKMLSSAGKISELTSNIKDWQTFIKDGMSGLIEQLTSSNHEIQEMLEDPRMKEYFETESPELKTLLDLSKILVANKVFGKWVAKRLPIIGGVELAINMIYDGTDWYLSYKRLAEANKINGRMMDSARDLQQHIDETYLALQSCPQG